MKNLIIGLHMAARGGKGALEQIVAAEQAGSGARPFPCFLEAGAEAHGVRAGVRRRPQ